MGIVDRGAIGQKMVQAVAWVPVRCLGALALDRAPHRRVPNRDEDRVRLITKPRPLTFCRLASCAFHLFAAGYPPCR